MTSQEPETPQSADHELPDTEVLAVSAPTPVFVDSTGRRRRRLQRVAYAFGAVCVLYGGLISVSLAGGPVSSSAIRSLPELPDHEVEPGQTRPGPTPGPVVSTSAKTRLISEPLPSKLPAVAERRFVAPQPPPPAPAPKTSSAKPTKTPAPVVTTVKPPVSTPPSSSPTPVPPSPTAVAPRPPAATTAAGSSTSVQASGRNSAAAAPPSAPPAADPEPSTGTSTDAGTGTGTGTEEPV